MLDCIGFMAALPLQMSSKLDTAKSDLIHRACLFAGNRGLKARWSAESQAALNEEVSYVNIPPEQGPTASAR